MRPIHQFAITLSHFASNVSFPFYLHATYTIDKTKADSNPVNNIQKEQRRKEEENIYKELKITLPICSITLLSMEERKRKR
jgi:hypothetical protein